MSSPGPAARNVTGLTLNRLTANVQIIQPDCHRAITKRFHALEIEDKRKAAPGKLVGNRGYRLDNVYSEEQRHQLSVGNTAPLELGLDQGCGLGTPLWMDSLCHGGISRNARYVLRGCRTVPASRIKFTESRCNAAISHYKRDTANLLSYLACVL